MTEIMPPLSPALNCSITLNCFGKGALMLQRPNVTEVFIPIRLNSQMKWKRTTQKSRKASSPLHLLFSLKGPSSPLCIFAMGGPIMILRSPGFPSYIKSILGS